MKEKEKIYCKICDTQTNLTIDSFSRYHLKPCHNITLKDYYDEVLKKEDEGNCLHCGKETKFLGYNHGYAKFCSQKHQRKSEYTRNKISESFKNRDTDKENEKRRQTNLEKYGTGNVAQNELIKEKTKKTCIEKYGEEHTLGLKKCKKRRERSLKKNKTEINEERKNFWRKLNQEELDSIIDKRRDTFKERYDVGWNSQIESIKERIRQTNEEKGKWINNRRHDEYWSYWNDVRNETVKHRIRLFRLWDGNDYYTGERLVTNEEYKLHFPKSHPGTNPMQPTVDHKISIKYGFLNGIDAKEIGAFKNLCICSRSINSKKNHLIEREFRRLLK